MKYPHHRFIFFIAIILLLAPGAALAEEAVAWQDDLLGMGADALKVMASWEAEFFEKTGKYGDFDELETSGFVAWEEHTRASLACFQTQWYVTEDGSDFTIIAFPLSSTEQSGLMIDSRERVCAIAASDDIGYIQSTFDLFIEAEDTEWNDNGQYAFVDCGISSSRYDPLKLLLSGNNEDFIVSKLYVYMEPVHGYIYLSHTDTAYATIEYIPEFCETTDEFLHAFEIATLTKHAIGTLRSIGSCEQAYQRTNETGEFASFQDLLDDMFIAEGYTPDTMVENYRLLWLLNSDKSDFLVIAIPTELVDDLQIYVVDSSQIICSLEPTEIPSVRQAWHDAVEAENLAWETNGEYVWLDIEDLYLNEAMDSCALSWSYDPMRGLPNYIYISETGIIYEREEVVINILTPAVCGRRSEAE